MENLKQYEQFLFEKEGISPAIYKELESYFKSTSKPTMAGAQDYISKHKKGWKLSEEDFKEAKKEFKK
jgi:hypothetical protein